jgi:broad specificity phosphatase PhoE
MHSTRSARAGRRRHRKRKPLFAFRPARDDGQAGLTLDIYLARHGETEWSRSGRHTGRTDLPLLPEGEAQALALRQRLSGFSFDAVFSSPLMRAVRTAEIAGFPDPVLTPLLREYDYGEYEGVTSADIRASHPGWELFKDGCPGGETPAQVYARAQEFIRLCGTKGGQVLAFAHGHILRAVAVAWLRLDIAMAGGLQLDVGTLNRLREDSDHSRVLAMWNAP